MTRVRTTPELNNAAIRVLVRELGYPDAVRFITALRPGTGDYTKDRKALLKDWTLADVLNAAKAAQASQKKPKRKRSA